MLHQLIQQRVRNACASVKLAFGFGFGHLLLLLPSSSLFACYDLLHNLFYTLAPPAPPIPMMVNMALSISISGIALE
jgi:hypothetical protein